MKKILSFLFLIFIIIFFLFSNKEGYYGYDQQYDSPARDWTNCDINFYSVETAPNDNECCSNVSIWDPTLSLCHPECAKNKIWNKKINKCVDPSTRCPKGYSTYKGNGICGNPGFANEMYSNF